MAVIFIVEDNDTLREAIVTYIKLENHEVIEFDKTADVINSIDIIVKNKLVNDEIKTTSEACALFTGLLATNNKKTFTLNDLLFLTP